MWSRGRRRVAGLSLVLGALAVPASAQAQINWFRGATELTKGAPGLSVPSTGKITILIVGLREIHCQTKGTEELSNPAVGFGEDSITKLALSRCRIAHPLCPETKTVEVLPLGLPWHSELFAASTEGDRLEGVKLEVRCKVGHTLHLFEGSLQGPVAKGSIELEGLLGEAEPHREAKVDLLQRLKSRHGKITAH
jgi:hypothetical protein